MDPPLDPLPPSAMGYRCVCTPGTVRHKAQVQSKGRREKLFCDVSWTRFAAVETQTQVRCGSTAPQSYGLYSGGVTYHRAQESLDGKRLRFVPGKAGERMMPSILYPKTLSWTKHCLGHWNAPRNAQSWTTDFPRNLKVFLHTGGPKRDRLCASWLLTWSHIVGRGAKLREAVLAVANAGSGCGKLPWFGVEARDGGASGELRTPSPSPTPRQRSAVVHRPGRIPPAGLLLGLGPGLVAGGAATVSTSPDVHCAVSCHW